MTKAALGAVSELPGRNESERVVAPSLTNPEAERPVFPRRQHGTPQVGWRGVPLRAGCLATAREQGQAGQLEKLLLAPGRNARRRSAL